MFSFYCLPVSRMLVKKPMNSFGGHTSYLTFQLLNGCFHTLHICDSNQLPPPPQVVHPSAGHWTGTLVNALLHHCGLPPTRVPSGSLPPKGLMGSESEEAMDASLHEDEDHPLPPLTPAAGVFGAAPTVRPGIVHRLDKGTTGLLVVAKVPLPSLPFVIRSTGFKPRFEVRKVVRAVAFYIRPLAGSLAGWLAFYSFFRLSLFSCLRIRDNDKRRGRPAHTLD